MPRRAPHPRNRAVKAGSSAYRCGEHLHRHVAIEPEVAGPVHARHAASRELRLDRGTDPPACGRRALEPSLIRPPRRDSRHRRLQLAERRRGPRPGAGGARPSSRSRSRRDRCAVRGPPAAASSAAASNSASGGVGRVPRRRPERRPRAPARRRSSHPPCRSTPSGPGALLLELADRIDGREPRRQLLVRLVESPAAAASSASTTPGRDRTPRPGASRRSSRRLRPCWRAARRSTPAPRRPAPGARRVGARDPGRRVRARAARRASRSSRSRRARRRGRPRRRSARSAGSAAPATTLAAPIRAASSAGASSRLETIDRDEGVVGAPRRLPHSASQRDLGARGAATEDDDQRDQRAAAARSRLPIMAGWTSR